jgi:hypothetical protein
MLCPSCNQFAAQSADSDPELELDVDQVTDDAVIVTGNARIVVTSECCGDELKEANFDVEISMDFEGERVCYCDSFAVVSASASTTEDYDRTKTTTLKDGTVKTTPIAPRYQTHYYGVEVEVTIRCDCGKTELEGTFSDKIPASSMDELV